MERSPFLNGFSTPVFLLILSFYTAWAVNLRPGTPRQWGFLDPGNGNCWPNLWTLSLGRRWAEHSSDFRPLTD